MKILPYSLGFSAAYENYFQIKLNVSESEQRKLSEKLSKIESLEILDYFAIYNQLDLVLHEDDVKLFDEIVKEEKISFEVFSKDLNEKIFKATPTADFGDFDYWPYKETQKFYDGLNEKYPDFAAAGPFGLTRHLKPLPGLYIRDNKKSNPEKRYIIFARISSFEYFFQKSRNWYFMRYKW